MSVECTCGCGKDSYTVLREIMRSGSLNEDQAEDQLIRANAARDALKEEA